MSREYPNLLPYAYNDCRYELGSTRLCLCSDFKQDNLRYLETMSIKRLTEGQK